MKSVKRNHVSVSVPNRRVRPPCQVYMVIKRAQKIASTLHLDLSAVSFPSKLVKLLSQLNIQECPNTADVIKALDVCLRDLCLKKQEDALRLWKSKVASWNLSSGALFAYLRNPEPVKSVMLQDTSGAWVCSPPGVHLALQTYWSSIESWPSEDSKMLAYELLDDKYSMFLPVRECHCELDVNLVVYRVKHLSLSSPGLDGWSVHELKALPRQAWEHLVSLWKHAFPGFRHTFFALVKRIPIAKVADSVPTPDQIRPIDVYSLIVRVMSSATVDGIRGWLRSVLHPNQHATMGGTLIATGKLNRCAEGILAGLTSKWCVSVDFVKLFNAIDVSVAARVARFMGLSQATVDTLVAPLLHSKKVWRLAENQVVPFVSSERGIPQGLSASVALAEIFLAALIWRTTRATGSGEHCLRR